MSGTAQFAAIPILINYHENNGLNASRIRTGQVQNVWVLTMIVLTFVLIAILRRKLSNNA